MEETGKEARELMGYQVIQGQKLEPLSRLGVKASEPLTQNSGPCEARVGSRRKLEGYYNNQDDKKS